MSTICNNLKHLRKQAGLTQEEFAEILGIKRSLLGAYEEKRATPKTELLAFVADRFDLTLDDLILRDLNEERTAASSFLEQRRRQKMETPDNSIIFVPMKAAAGYISGFADQEFISELNTFTLPMITGNGFRAFEIEGDSMLPVESGSIIVCNQENSLDYVKEGLPYVVVGKDGIVYKRIQKMPQEKNKVLLISDNPMYQPYPIHKKDIVELWMGKYVINPVRNSIGSFNALNNVVEELKKQVDHLSKQIGH